MWAPDGKGYYFVSDPDGTFDIYYRRIDGRWRFYERNTNLLYVLKLTDLPTAFADRMRIRWPGSDRTEAEVGADVSGGRTMEPRGV